MDIRKENSQYLLNTYNKSICLENGKGCIVYDSKGKRYIDFIGGIATCSVGHAHPAVVTAISSQANSIINPSNLFYSKPQIQLAKKLISLSKLDKCFFSNSGTEAIETAIKLVRKVTKKKQIVAMKNGFHGRTLGSLSATWTKKYKKPFEPLTPGFKHAEYGDIVSLKKNLNQDTAGVLMEPIQGEAGVIVPSPGYLKKAQDLCTERGILLILDEIQTGCGRTGKFFCFQHEGLQPDIVTIAKGLANGIPIGVTLAAKGLDFKPGDHGSTFGGNNLSCTAALATISVVEKALPHVEAKGKKIMSALREMTSVKEVRGKGLMIGAVTLGNDYVTQCALKGLLVNSPHPGVLRMLPPLTITNEEIDDALLILKQVLNGGGDV